jgi:hypothetical protein
MSRRLTRPDFIRGRGAALRVHVLIFDHRPAEAIEVRGELYLPPIAEPELQIAAPEPEGGGMAEAPDPPCRACERDAVAALITREAERLDRPARPVKAARPAPPVPPRPPRVRTPAPPTPVGDQDAFAGAGIVERIPMRNRRFEDVTLGGVGGEIV